MFDRDTSAFKAILESNIIFPGVTQTVIKEKIDAQSKGIESVQHHLMIDNQLLASDIIIGKNPDLSTLSIEHLEACQLAQTLHAERLSLDNSTHKDDIDFALNIVRDSQSVIYSSEKNAIKYLEMLSANNRLNYESNKNFNSKTDLLSTALSGTAILSTLNPITKITSASISNAAILATGIKKDNNEPGITPTQWEKIPLAFRNSKTFKAAVLTNENIELQDKVHKNLFSSYIEKNDELLETNVEMTKSIINYINTMKSSQPTTDSKEISSPRPISKIDIVMLHSLGNIESKLDAINKELKEVKNQKKFQENIRGFQQSISTLHQFGTLFKSPPLQKTAEALNQTLNLTIGFSQITHSMPALLEVAAGIGGVLGPVGMVVSATLGLVSLFGRNKKQENAFPRIMVEYLQTICKQIYHLHQTVIEGFTILEKNQHKQMKIMIESVKHLDILIRAEAHHTRMAITDLSRHLDNSIEQLIEHITESNKELHLQSLKKLMDRVDFCIEEKDLISPEKVKEVAHKLISWIKPGTHFAASPLHTGSINLSSLRNEIYSPITNRLAGADSSQKIVMKNIGLLGTLLSEFKIPLEQKEELNVSSLPYPPLWFKVVNKYITFREHFPDILIDKTSLIHIENSKKNMSLLIELLQNKEEIYTHLLDGYESALKTIVSILNQATQAKNKEINAKLFKSEDQKELKDETIFFDITRDLDETLRESEDTLFRHQDMTGEKFQTRFNRFPNNICFQCELAGYSVNIPQLVYKADKIQSHINEQKQNIFLSKALLSHQLGLLNITSNYQLELMRPGGEDMGILIFKFHIADPSKVSKKLFDVRYALDGNASGQKRWHEQGSCYTNITGFDSDFSQNIGEFESCLPIQYTGVKVGNIVEAYINKKRFDRIDFPSDFKEVSTSVSDNLNQFVIKKRKEIITDIYGATLGRAQEIYQEPLKKAYEKLDFYLALLKAYASLAGLTSFEEQKISTGISTLPYSIINLPDSHYIENELKDFLDTTTIFKEWPLTHLTLKVKSARDDMASAIRSLNWSSELKSSMPTQPLQSSSSTMIPSVPVLETKSETQVSSPIIFVSPLQIQLACYMAPIHLMLELLDQEEHVVKIIQFTKEERELIFSKLPHYKNYYDLYEDWIQDIKEDNKYHLKLNQQLQKAFSDLKIIEKTMTNNIFSVHICPILKELHETFIQIHNGLSTCYKRQFNLSLENISGNGSDFQKLCKKYEKYNHKVTNKDYENIIPTEDLEQKRLPVGSVFHSSSPINPVRAPNSEMSLSFASDIPIVPGYSNSPNLLFSTSESSSEMLSDKKTNEKDQSITYSSGSP